MNIDTYFKVYGYACLYKSTGERVDEIKRDDITISMIRDGKPRELLEFFRESGYSIIKTCPGIYHVKKDGMSDTQIVVSGELKEAEQIWLRALAPGLEKSVLDVFLQKTSGALTQGWRDLMADEIEEAMKKAVEEAVEKTVKKTEAYIQEATGISEDKLGLMREQM